MKKYKFITIESDGDKGFVIRNNRIGNVIGYITHYAPWRGWVMTSYSENTVWSADCLEDVIDFIKNEIPKKK